jgi:uncharacterized membrane-anchored protein YhcB (DUF1043 family)
MEGTPIVWLALAGGLLLGALCAFLLQRRFASADRERCEQLTAELEETRDELASHREEVAVHFSQTSQLFRALTEQYTRLYAHLAEGAREFATETAPALARGFDGPLLGHEGDDAAEEAHAETTQVEARPSGANGGSPVQ